MLCVTTGKCTCTIYEQKNPVCIQILRAYTGIGDAETPSPGMLRKPGDLPKVCPRPKKFKRRATRDTLHGSHRNLRQRDPNGRIVPTPSDVSDDVASTKRCAPLKKVTIIRIHMCRVCGCAECHSDTYIYIYIESLGEAAVESSTLPVGMEVDSGLRTIAWGCCWSSPGGLPLSPPPVLRAGCAH